MNAPKCRLALAHGRTGPALELTDKTIVVQKGEDNRTADTKVADDLKVGAKVTIKYTMTANDVEVKSDK